MRVAVLGTGWAASRHVNFFKTDPEIKLVGVASPTEAHRVEMAKQWGTRPYADLNEILEHEKVDAVWITVPPDQHGAIERQLIANRIPFFVEKPLSADRQTAEDIGEALARSGLIAGVGYHWRAMETLKGVRQKLAERPARMVIGQWLSTTPGPRWWHTQATSGGQFVEQATHLVDLARYLVGEGKLRASLTRRHDRPAYPHMDVADASAALVEFGGGAVGVFSATPVLAGSTTVQLQIACEGLMMTITQASVIYDQFVEKHEVRQTADMYIAEDRAFVAALRSNDRSLVLSTYEDALLTHRLCHDMREQGE